MAHIIRRIILSKWQIAFLSFSSYKFVPKQLTEATKRFKDHKSSLETGLSDISYSVLVLGSAIQKGDWKTLSKKLIASMGQLAIKQVNRTEIRSLDIVRNNRLVKSYIRSTQKGHFKTTNGYGQRLDDLDEITFETTQVELSVFQVFPANIFL